MLKTYWKPITGILIGLAILVAGTALWYQHRRPSPDTHSGQAQAPLKGSPTVPSTQGGHWHGDEWHAEPHDAPADAHRDAYTDAHGPPVRVPPRPGPLKPLPPELVRHMQNNPKIMPADTPAGRKRQALENPEILWQPFFIIPDPVDHHYHHTIPPTGDELWDYTTVADAVTYSDSQKERIRKVTQEIVKKRRAGTLSPAEEKRLVRKRENIRVEGLDPLTAAKYLLRHQPVARMELAQEYASRAVRKAPKSTEARHVLGLVLERMNKNEEAVAVYRQMLALDENSVIALWELATSLRATRPQEALGYMKKAIQLDARIPPYNYILAECYEYGGQYDKALEVYQNMPYMDSFTWSNIIYIQTGDPEIKPVVEETQ